MPKLHELLAVEATREAEASVILNETQNTFVKKHEHFLGKHSAYTSFEEGSLEEEPTNKEIVTTVASKLSHCFEMLGTALDITASKDATNQVAVAKIIIEGKEITSDLPATTLLNIEARLKKWLDLFKTIPTLAPARPWQLDADKGEGIFIDTAPEPRFRTKRVIKHKILVEPTQFHKAEIEKWTEDERVGKTIDTSWSGMMSTSDKSKLLSRTQDMIVATKQARQRANCQEIVKCEPAAAIIRQLLFG